MGKDLDKVERTNDAVRLRRRLSRRITARCWASSGCVGDERVAREAEAIVGVRQHPGLTGAIELVRVVFLRLTLCAITFPQLRNRSASATCLAVYVSHALAVRRTGRRNIRPGESPECVRLPVLATVRLPY